MRRIKLVVAYDGTDYCGFQVQNNGPTIEGELNRVLSELFGEEIRTFNVEDAALEEYSVDKARTWLLDAFDAFGCVPPNPMGKLLSVDLILGVARAAGMARFDTDPLWSGEFALAASRLRDATGLEVDVEAYELRDS